MSYVSRFRVDATCTASAATIDTPVTMGGLFYGMRYTPGTASGLATGSTCTLAVIGPSGVGNVNILTFTGTSAAALIFPRFEMHTTAGATAGGTTAGSFARMPVGAGDLIRLTIASGGASGNAHFDLYLEGQF